MPDLTEYLDILILFGVGAVCLVAVVWILLSKVRRLEHLLEGVNSRMADTPAVDETLIRLWRKQYESLPRGSVKWNAYRARLIEAGVRIDGY